MRSWQMFKVGLVALASLASWRADVSAQPMPTPVDQRKPIGAWTGFRGPNGTGIVDEKLTLVAKSKELWKQTVGNGCASLTIQNGRLYTVGAAPKLGTQLYCLDTATGKILWQQTTGCWYQASTPALDKGRVYLLSTPENRPVAACHDAESGKVIWRRELTKPAKTREYGHAGSPLLWEGLMILNVGAGVALKQDTGEIAWQHEGRAGLATPVLYQENGQARVLIFAGEALIARDARTGRELWSIPWKTDLAVNACDPIYHDGKVFISTTYGKHGALFDVRGKSPEMLWKTRGTSFSSGLLHDKKLYCFTGDNFACLDFESGEEHWSRNVGKGSALLLGDQLAILSENGELLVGNLSATSFKPNLRHAVLAGTNWTPPAFANGRLYVRNKEGHVVCLQIGADQHE